jgi:hypothetical protein
MRLRQVFLLVALTCVAASSEAATSTPLTSELASDHDDTTVQRSLRSEFNLKELDDVGKHFMKNVNGWMDNSPLFQKFEKFLQKLQRIKEKLQRKKRST